MRSRPASQLADDGEAVGMSPAVDPSSAEPLPHRDGVRKSVGPALDGSDPNANNNISLSQLLQDSCSMLIRTASGELQRILIDTICAMCSNDHKVGAQS